MTRPTPHGAPVLPTAIAATALASNYVIQPALPAVAADLHVSPTAIGLVPTAALCGSVIGYAFLVPLADHIAANRLIATQLAAMAIALAVGASAPSMAVLAASYLVVGATASVAAQAGLIANRHALPERRSRTVATVAAGMSAGILLGRFAGGMLSDTFGWRHMLLVIAGLAVLGAVAATALPASQPRPGRGYAATLAALLPLLRTHPRLRHATACGGLWYFAFNLIWVGLTVALAAPPYRLGPGAIGWYSLAGLLGLAALPLSGRLADRHSPRTAIAASMAVSATGAVLLASGLNAPAVTVLGLGLFDAGCFAAQAANQSRIMAVDPPRSGSLSGVYLVVYFTAGAAGTALAGPLVAVLAWRAAALIASVVSLLVVSLVVRTAPTAPQREHVLLEPPYRS